MANLYNRKPSDTYKSLLKVGTSDNQSLDSTARVVEDGEGTASILYLSTSEVQIKAVTATSPGGGFDAATTTSYVSKLNGEIVSTFLIDIGGGSIISSSDTGDVIGEDGIANAYFTRVVTAINGTVYGGEMSCIEVPTTGDADINLCANSSGTIAEDAGGESQHVLVDGGTWTLGKKADLTIPSGGIQTDYLYLTHGGTTNGIYNAGKFIIKLYAANF